MFEFSISIFSKLWLSGLCYIVNPLCYLESYAVTTTLCSGDQMMGHDIDNLKMELGSGIAAYEAKYFGDAAKLLSPLADQGEPEAQYRMAIMAQNGLGIVKNELMAYKYMRAAAEAGLALAQHGLGFMYLEGECIGQDYAHAVEWFTRAAEQGMSGSMTTLAMLYEEGRGVEKDPEKAKMWYEKAGF
jgi:TPR repeat protein